jgi:two-component system chemotaxis response regulator CheY
MQPNPKIKKSVLIIDDDTHIRSMLQTAFTQSGFQVIEANNGLEGLKLAQEHNFCCIITDLKMPQMDGLELIEQLQKIPTIEDKNCHIIVYSNIAQDYVIQEVVKKGATRLLLKDETSPSQLVKIVSKLVE